MSDLMTSVAERSPKELRELASGTAVMYGCVILLARELRFVFDVFDDISSRVVVENTISHERSWRWRCPYRCPIR